MPVSPVGVNDFGEICINLVSLRGALDLHSINWLPIHIQDQPPLDKIRDYNRFEHLTKYRDFN